MLDINRDFATKVNMEMVELSGIEDPTEIAFVRGLIEDHHHYTGSELAARILQDFNRALPRFVKVLPVDYKRVLEEQAAEAEAAKKAEFYLPLLPGRQPKKPENEKADKDKVKMADIEESVGDAKAEKKRSAMVLDKTKGFMKYQRRGEKYRNVKARTRDWQELSNRLTEDELKYQTARCMDCGVPFCQSDTGCPVSNIIPKSDTLLYSSLW